MQLTPLGTRALNLGTNRGTASLAPILAVGPTGPQGPEGPSGPALPAEQVAFMADSQVPWGVDALGVKPPNPRGTRSPAGAWSRRTTG